MEVAATDKRFWNDNIDQLKKKEVGNDPRAPVQPIPHCIDYDENSTKVYNHFTIKPVGLQNCLDVLGKYCSEWKLCVNMEKSNIMIFNGRTVDETLYGFYYKHQTINITNGYKYLGVVFTSDGKMKFAAEQLPERAKRHIMLWKQIFLQILISPWKLCCQ